MLRGYRSGERPRKQYRRAGTAEMAGVEIRGRTAAVAVSPKGWLSSAVLRGCGFRERPQNKCSKTRTAKTAGMESWGIGHCGTSAWDCNWKPRWGLAVCGGLQSKRWVVGSGIAGKKARESNTAESRPESASGNRAGDWPSSRKDGGHRINHGVADPREDQGTKPRNWRARNLAGDCNRKLRR